MTQIRSLSLCRLFSQKRYFKWQSVKRIPHLLEVQPETSGKHKHHRLSLVREIKSSNIYKRKHAFAAYVRAYWRESKRAIKGGMVR